MKWYVGKASDESQVLEAAGAESGAVIAASIDLDRVEVVYIGIVPPPNDARLIFTLFAPAEGGVRPEQWELGIDGRCWYTRDLCAVRA